MTARRSEPSSEPSVASRHWRFGLGVVLVLAAIVRLAYVAELRATPWFDRLVVDPEYYDQWAFT